MVKPVHTRAALHIRPDEAAFLQLSREQAGSLAVMPNHFDQVTFASRKQNKWLARRSCFKISCTRRARVGKPHRMSVCPVASQTLPLELIGKRFITMPQATDDPQQRIDVDIPVDDLMPPACRDDRHPTGAAWGMLHRCRRHGRLQGRASVRHDQGGHKSLP
jgi:hypothetical protein